MSPEDIKQKKEEVQREMKAWWRIYKDLLKIETYDVYGGTSPIKKVYFNCQKCDKRITLDVPLDKFSRDEYSNINTIVEYIGNKKSSCDNCYKNVVVDPPQKIKELYSTLRWN